MKKTLFNPNFEIIFAMGIVTMLLLPPMVMAQQPPKDFKVIIENNDTTINGKNIKQLSAGERATALKDMADLSKDIRITSTGKSFDHVTYLRRRNDDRQSKLDTTRIVYFDPKFGKQEISIPRSFRMRIDTVGDHIEPHIEEMYANRPTTQSFSFRNDDEGNSPRRMHMSGPGSRNSQSFNYSNTNKDGFSTYINYTAGDVNKETTKRIAGVEKPELVIENLMINPSFSTGKTNLSFTLTEKASAEVQFKDSDGKVLWTDKTSGSFYKSFELPLNGIYFLQVKQGNKVGLRRIVKEQ